MENAANLKREGIQMMEGVGCHQFKSSGAQFYSNKARNNPITKYQIKAM